MGELSVSYCCGHALTVTIKDNLVIDVSTNIIVLTGYSKDTFLNESIDNLCRILFNNTNVTFSDIARLTEAYIFTKNLETRDVLIDLKHKTDNDKIALTFIEKPNSRLEDNFAYACRMCDDNLTGVAIYSAPGLQLLKANSHYLEYWSPPNNILKSALGKSIYTILPDWKNSEIERLWINIISDKKLFSLRNSGMTVLLKESLIGMLLLRLLL